MNLDERMAKGSRAREILENEVFKETFDQIEKEIIEQWTNSPARDEAGRQSLWLYLKVLQRVQTQLQTTMETGRLAQLELRHQESLTAFKSTAWIG